MAETFVRGLGDFILRYPKLFFGYVKSYDFFRPLVDLVNFFSSKTKEGKRLSNNRLFFWVCYKKKFMVTNMPKNGMTALKRVIVKEDKLNCSLEKVHYFLNNLNFGYRKVSFESAMKKKYKNFVKFIVYRDPVDRFVSFYKNKLMEEYRSDTPYHYLGLVGKDPDEVLDFVEKELLKPFFLQEEHVGAQYPFYAFSYDYVVPLDKLNKFMKEKFDVDLSKGHNSTSHVRFKLNNQQKERVRKLYRKDFLIKPNYS